jgi:Ca-activated chloride channel family protein
MNTFSFHSKEFLWLLLLLPPVIYLVRRKKWAALSFPHTEILRKAAGLRRPKSQKILSFLRFSALTLLIFALARPQWIRHFQESNLNGVDIMLAVDVSPSMMGLDFHEEHERKITTRLDIAIQVTNEFIQNRANDRIGMCTFAGDASLVSAVTMNHE